MCRGDWKTHGSHTGGFYNCKLYDKSEAKKIDEKAKQLKEENSLFLSYFDDYIKYNNRIRSLTQREDDLGKIQEKMIKQTGKVVHELIEAAEVCKEAYNVIKFSVVFTYFIREYEQITRLFKFRMEKEVASVNELFEKIDQIETVGFEQIQELRKMIKLTRKTVSSLSDVTTEVLMKNRYDEAKKKKGKK